MLVLAICNICIELVIAEAFEVVTYSVNKFQLCEDVGRLSETSYANATSC
jgi:hypothetical protein